MKIFKYVIVISLILSIAFIFMTRCNKENPRVEIKMDDGSTMIIELYPEYAPETVKNFAKLVKKGFYDGLTFHRIYEGFMIQGGDPNGDGTGGSGKSIKGEFKSNGYKKNTLSHTRGVISMARRPDDLDSATSQFFIMHADNPGLNGDYASFGKLIEGEETLDQIAATPVLPNARGEKSVPVDKVVIKSITMVKK